MLYFKVVATSAVDVVSTCGVDVVSRSGADVVPIAGRSHCEHGERFSCNVYWGDMFQCNMFTVELMMNLSVVS